MAWLVTDEARWTTGQVRQEVLGYLAALILVYGWFSGSLGPNVLVVLSVVTVLYTVFQAPVWCCAETRNQEFCRNNAHGIVMGCWTREHRWQELKWFVRSSTWGRLFRRLLPVFTGLPHVLPPWGLSFPPPPR